MREFDLIRRLQEQVESSGPDCVLGIGDDAAVLDCPPGRQLVVCTDTLVEGVHFPPGTSPEAIGHKALAVNLSDLAAMGSEPGWFQLALTLPAADAQWLDRFASGLSALAASAGVRLIGGDTTTGPLSLTVTAIGLVEPGRALTRSGARPGDLVVVSGELGLAASALHRLGAGLEPDPSCRHALDYPQPRLRLGRLLTGLASACIDVSDGLLADLGHVIRRSKTGARIETGALPCPAALAQLPEQDRWALQLTGGDDYELCFTLPPEALGKLETLSAESGVALTVIGEVVESPGLQVVRPDGAPFDTPGAGWEHFSTTRQGAAP